MAPPDVAAVAERRGTVALLRDPITDGRDGVEIARLVAASREGGSRPEDGDDQKGTRGCSVSPGAVRHSARETSRPRGRESTRKLGDGAHK